MNVTNPLTAITLSLVGFAGQPYLDTVEPALMLQDSLMPTFVPEEYRRGLGISEDSPKSAQEISEAVKLYHQLKNDFSLSVTEMSRWLGVKRRTLYNWAADQERAKIYGPKIEERLFNLSMLYNEMDQEHREYLFKIAFSPIYGDPEFGESILAGKGGQELTGLYDSLYSKFETFRKISLKRESAG